MTGNVEETTAVAAPKPPLHRRFLAFIRLVLANITVEPCCLAMAVGGGMFSVVASEIYIEKVCKVRPERIIKG